MIAMLTCAFNKKIIFAAVLVAGIMSCKKSTDTPEENKPEPSTGVATGIYTLTNVAADTSATSGATAKPLYYSLENNKAVDPNLLQTDNWDIAFSGTYNSNIIINNGKAIASPGFGGPGKGASYLQMFPDIDAQYYNAATLPIKSIPARSLFDDAFDRVKTVPADEQLNVGKIIGLDYFSGSEDGWAYYDFYGKLFPGRPADSVAHVSYTLPRPIIVRTAKGNYAKIVVYSVYKGAPVTPTRSYKPGFVTFKYAIQKDGSKNLDIK